MAEKANWEKFTNVTGVVLNKTTTGLQNMKIIEKVPLASMAKWLFPSPKTVHKKYHVFTAVKSWWASRDHCRKLGGDLATLTSEGLESGHFMVWIGAVDYE